MPDYLDTPDLLVRRAANQLAPSLTGRWGERLSVGVTRALTQALSARLPAMAVVSLPPVGTPALRLLVDVEAFEARPNSTCILVARWSATGGARQTLAAERVSLVEPVAQGAGEPSGDAAVASAMTRAIDALADRIAAGVQRAIPTYQRRTTSRPCLSTLRESSPWTPQFSPLPSVAGLAMTPLSSIVVAATLAAAAAFAVILDLVKMPMFARLKIG